MRCSSNVSRRAGSNLAAVVSLVLSAASGIGQGAPTGTQSDAGKQPDRGTKQAEQKVGAKGTPEPAKGGPDVKVTENRSSGLQNGGKGAQEATKSTSAEAFGALLEAIMALDAKTKNTGGSGRPGGPSEGPPGGGAGESAKNDPVAASYEGLIIAALDQPGVKVTVRKIGAEAAPKVGSNYVAVLTGKMTSKDDSEAALARLDRLLTTAKLDDVVLVNVLDAGIAKHHETDVSHLWRCGFIQGDADFDAKVKLQNVADALNILLPCETGRPYVTVKDTNLWLQGPLNRVQAIRAMLAMIDAPLPQVRLDVWAIQYAGSQKTVGKRMLDLNQEITQAQQGAELARGALAYAIRKNAALINADPTFMAIRDVGFDMDPMASQSLIEYLWCVGICKDRDVILHDAIAALQAQLPTQPSWLTAALKSENALFPNLTHLLAPTGPAAAYNTLLSDQQTLQNFVASLKQYIAFVDALGVYGPVLGDNPDDLLLDYPAAPEALTRQSLAVDRQLELLVKAYSADMEQMFFMPLLQQAQQWSYGGSGGGIGLAGKTTIAVTSRFNASVTPTLQAYGERQTPRMLGDQLLSPIQKAAAAAGAAQSPTNSTTVVVSPGDYASRGSSSGGTSGVTTGGSTVFPSAAAGQGAAQAPAGQNLTSIAQGLAAGLTTPEKAALVAALQPTADIAYYSVAPGIAIHVTPIMTPDGGTADLKLDASFGVDTHVQKDDVNGAQTFRPPDAVKEDHVQTQVNVGGFNLFEVSSFNMDTQYPRPPFITPVLGNLPVFGNMFRFGRGDSRTYHQSVILVNATLIPRSLGLIGFYGANFAGRRVLTANIPTKPVSRGAGQPLVNRPDPTKKVKYEDFLGKPTTVSAASPGSK